MESIDRRRQANSGTIALMEEEMGEQVLALPKFRNELERNSDSRRPDPSDLVFTGSGDSYATSLFAHYLSKRIAHAADPNDLSEGPDACKDRLVYITSVSGLTRANILLARRIKRISRKRVAVTANLDSRLAQVCDQIINLPYRRKGAVTPGTLSFSLSLLATASRIIRLPSWQDLDRISASAGEWARQFSTGHHGSFVFIGSGVGYALAAYGAFKVQEVLGQAADYVHSEQLGHSKLFSIRKTDSIVCFASPDDKKTREVSRILAENGFNLHLLLGHERDPIRSSLEAAFAFQDLSLRLAKKRGLKDASFLTDKKRLRLSSRLIY